IWEHLIPTWWAGTSMGEFRTLDNFLPGLLPSGRHTPPLIPGYTFALLQRRPVVAYMAWQASMPHQKSSGTISKTISYIKNKSISRLLALEAPWVKLQKCAPSSPAEQAGIRVERLRALLFIRKHMNQ